MHGAERFGGRAAVERPAAARRVFMASGRTQRAARRAGREHNYEAAAACAWRGSGIAASVHQSTRHACACCCCACCCCRRRLCVLLPCRGSRAAAGLTHAGLLWRHRMPAIAVRVELQPGRIGPNFRQVGSGHGHAK